MKAKEKKLLYDVEIPSDWEIKSLGEITSLCTNGFVGKVKDHYDDSDEGILYVQGFNVTEGGFNYFGIKKVTKAFHRKNNKSEVKEGDLLTIQTGDIGVTTIVTKELEGANCHALVISRFIHKYVYPYFYMHYFNSEIGRRIFRKIETGSTMKHLNVGDMISLELPLPPLPEQRAIAKFLSTWDEAIRKTQTLIAQKELRKKWLMQNLLTGKKRLKGVEGDWMEVKMSDVFERVTRKNKEGNTNVVTISAQRGFVKQTEFFNKSIASELLDGYFLVRRGEFCYNKSYSNGYPWGATKRLNTFEKAVVTTLYICFRIKDGRKSEGDFFEQFFDANYLDKGLTRIAHEGGRAHGLLNVTPTDFFDLKITIPPLEEQTGIAQILQAADTEIQLLKAKVKKLKTQKMGLMQVLLTGKKRLTIKSI